ncbi:MAG: YfcE family phosphodiesterase [Eubacterium sp.]|nr:YfcE family phosphodiesterase [Eubacterium sp.]
MKIVVFSDSHRDYHKLKYVVEHNLDADAFIHLGDGEHEFNDVRNLHPEKSFLFVKGNCDYADNKTIRIANANGIKILCVHGHEQDVHRGLETLLDVARQNGCQIALYGHTHLYRTENIGGIYVMNPGSIDSPRDKRPPSYGVITISDDKQITMNIVALEFNATA